jgi:hypothetical protein
LRATDSLISMSMMFPHCVIYARVTNG